VHVVCCVCDNFTCIASPTRDYSLLYSSAELLRLRVRVFRVLSTDSNNVYSVARVRSSPAVWAVLVMCDSEV